MGNNGVNATVILQKTAKPPGFFLLLLQQDARDPTSSCGDVDAGPEDPSNGDMSCQSVFICELGGCIALLRMTAQGHGSKHHQVSAEPFEALSLTPFFNQHT